MNPITSSRQFILIACLALLPTITFAQSTIRPAAVNRTDANGNAIRVAARTGHVSNYDESKVGNYTLPDPLVLLDGQPVRDAETWYTKRRPEILAMYENEIYGKVPDNAPSVTWEVASTDAGAMNGTAVLKHLVGHIGPKADGPKMNVSLYIPAKSGGPVPVILCLNFNFGGARGARGARAGAGAATLPTARARGRGPVAGGDPIADILGRGWAYATIFYTDIQPDSANTFTSGVIGLTLAPGQTAPAANEWGTVSAWAWGVSRIVDYFQTDSSINGRQIAIMGHSRLGKTVLWAGARDTRIAAVFSSCGGELGSSLARRDFGETVDDMAQNFPWQFAGNLQKYAGHWNDLPVDTHMLIALNAPHPVFICGGTTDQWSDPKGEFLAEVAAGPVYKLLGKQDLGVSELPPLDTPQITGDLGWDYHTGGHMAAPIDWKGFLNFAAKYFTPGAASATK